METLFFLMQDSYVTVKDLLTLFKKDERIEKDIKFNKSGNQYIQVCVSKLKNRFQFRNTMPYHNAVFILYLVKLTKINDDVLRLIKKCISNKFSPIVLEEEKIIKKGVLTSFKIFYFQII